MPGREEEHQGGVSRRLVNERVFQRGIIGWRGEATLGGRVSAGFRFFVLIIIHTHTHTVDVFIFVRSIVPSIHPSTRRTYTTTKSGPKRLLNSTRARARFCLLHKRNISKLPYTREISQNYTREISQKNTRRRRPIVKRRFKGGSRNRLYDDMTISCMYKQNVFWVYRYRYTTLFGRCL